VELEFTYTFDTAFIRTALRRDFFWKVYLIIGLLAAIPIIHRLWAGMFDPYVIGIAALGIVFVSVRLTLAFRKGAERVFELWSKQSPDHTLRYRLGPEGEEAREYVVERCRAASVRV